MVPRVRRALGRWLERADIVGDAAYDALVVTSEVVTDHLQRGGRQLLLRAWRGADHVSIQVDGDVGSTVDEAGGHAIDAIQRMVVIDALSDERVTHRSARRRTICCRLPVV